MKTLVCGTVLALGTFLCAQSEEFGAWKPLFNGKDVSGWVNVRDANAGKPPERWQVEDGALTNGSGGVDDICSAEEFENYELELEYKIPPQGNSGIYLRGAIEVQILDSKGRTTNLGPGDVGGIYGGAPPLANPQKPAEWNKLLIKHVGYRIMGYHNDVVVQNNLFRAENTPGCHEKYVGTPRRGPVMFQGNHSKVWFRNIRIRPIASGDLWRPIWTGEKDDFDAAFSSSNRPTDKNAVRDAWAYDDHAVTNVKGRDMWTKEAFGNFLVHYEYRSQGNSGFYLRDQWEIQINRATKRPGKHDDGALYSLFAPAQAARNADAEWNHMDVKVQGVKIWVWQNGKLIHDGRVCATRTDNHGVPTPAFSKAPFKFQGDHEKVWFANIYIKPLPDGE